MKKGLALLFGLLAAAMFASAALANTQDPTYTAYIEICKAAAAPTATEPLALTGNFGFTWDNGGQATVAVGTCSSPQQVTLSNYSSKTGYGTVTIQETLQPWFSVQSITEPSDENSIVTGTNIPSAGSVELSLQANSSIAQSQIVTFTNQENAGVLEVCKSVATGSGLTGSYNFTVANAASQPAFSQQVSVQAGSCSQPITVPVGTVTVNEATPNNVVGISAYINGAPALTSANLATGSATVTVNSDPTGSDANETIATFTDDVSTLKLCKTWDSSTGLVPSGVTGFPFTFAVSGVAGPDGPTAGVTLPVPSNGLSSPNNSQNDPCVVVGTYRAGTTVGITEAPQNGTAVESIMIQGANASADTSSTSAGTANIITGSSNPSNPTISNGSATAPDAGETVVTYQDEDTTAGTLKICKNAAANQPAPNGPFVFALSPAANGGTASVTVPLGACSQPLNFPGNTAVKITETTGPNNVVQSITSNPSAQLSGVNLTTGVSTVEVLQGSTVDVTYVDYDPPAATTGGSSNSSSGGSSGGSSDSSNSGSPAAAGSTGVSITAPVTVPAPASTSTSTAIVSSNATTAIKIAELKKELSTLKAKVSKLEATLKSELNNEKALAKQIAKASPSKIAALELKFTKAVSYSNALAKVIAADKKVETKIAVDIALLQK